MILVIAGIYILIIGKLQVLKYYGLKGKGARWAGASLIAFGLGFFSVFSAPLAILGNLLGLGELGVTVVSFTTQIALLAAVLIVLVRIFGNAYAEAPRGL